MSPLNWWSHWSWWPQDFSVSWNDTQWHANLWWSPCGMINDFNQGWWVQLLLWLHHISEVWGHTKRYSNCPSSWPSILLEDPFPEKNTAHNSRCPHSTHLFASQANSLGLYYIHNHFPIGPSGWVRLSGFGSDCITLLRSQHCGAACLETFSHKIWTAGLRRCGLITNGWIRFS